MRGLSRGRVGGGERAVEAHAAGAGIGEAVGPGRRDRADSDGLGGRWSGETGGLAGGAPAAKEAGEAIGLAPERCLGGEQGADVAERAVRRAGAPGLGAFGDGDGLSNQGGRAAATRERGADEGDEVTTRTDHQQGIRGDIHDCPPFITGDRGACRQFAPRFGSALLSGLGGIGPRRAHVRLCLPSKRLAGFSSARLYSVFVR